MNKLLSLLIILSILGCKDKEHSKNNKEVSKTIDVLKKVKGQDLKSSNAEKRISEIATSFHRWYIKNTNDLTTNVSTGIEIIKGKDGKCVVDYQPYFNQLRKLNTISEKFIESEKQRTKDCAAYIEKMDWEQYETSEGYDLEEYCSFFYYQYWTQSQDSFDGLDVFEISHENNIWEIKIQFYFMDGNKKHYSTGNGSIPIIKVEEELNKYLITEINWVEI